MVEIIVVILAVSYLAGMLTVLFLQWVIIQRFVFGSEQTNCEIQKPEIRRCALPEVSFIFFIFIFL